MILLQPYRPLVAISGYFQVVHAGHIDYIKQAALLGDVVVIVNNDRQAKLKGTPCVVNEQDRAYIVSNIKGVYRTIIAKDNTRSVAKTLASLKPDIFFNSGDRNIDNIDPDEKHICEEYGIKIMYDKSPKRDSSSGIIERIRNT